MEVAEKPVAVTQAALLVERSHTAIQKAIASGRLTRCVVRDGKGKVKILLSVFKAEWEANGDPLAAARGSLGGRPPGRPAKLKPLSPPPPKPQPRPFIPEVPDHSPPADEPREFDGRGQLILDFTSSRKREAHFAAQMTELKVRERAGELTEVSAVKAEAFKVGRDLREAVLSVPERLASRLAAEIDPHKVHRLLLDELMIALKAVASAG